MAKNTFDKIINWIIDDIEGGFVHRSKKADPGGATKYGITRRTLKAWRKVPVSIQDVRNLTKNEAIEIYREQFWRTVRGDDLPVGVDFCVFDFGVNSGPGRAVRELQGVLGVKQDGIIGLMTMAAIDEYPDGHKGLIADLSKARLDFMKGLSNWGYNKNGWTKRVKQVMKEAQALLSGRLLPDMAPVSYTAEAVGENVSVSKALLTKETGALLTVAVPSISGLLSNFQPAQYVIAAFIAGAGILALYWGYKRVQRESI